MLNIDHPVSVAAGELMGEAIFIVDALHACSRARFWFEPRNVFKRQLLSYLGVDESQMLVQDQRPDEALTFHGNIYRETLAWPNDCFPLSIAKAFGVEKSYKPIRLNRWNPTANGVYLVCETFTREKRLHLEVAAKVRELFQPQ